MEDDDEDFQQLFFAECEELLGDLQSQLDALQTGDFDKETINAAFRAVHSVKGGAAAFGFEELISFAHSFENVMDLARSDELEVNDEFCSLMLRASDVMELLIEKAQGGDTSPTEKAERVLVELKQISGVDTGTDADTPDDAQAAGTSESDIDAELAEDEAEENSFDVIFRPDHQFFRAGHDMVKVIAAGKRIGLGDVEFVGNIPRLDALYFDECPYVWNFNFRTEKSKDDLIDFLNVYEAVATYEFVTDEDEDDTQEAPDSPPKENAETKVVEAKTPAATAKSEETAPQTSGKKARAAPVKSLRVELPKIDRLVNLVGEIVITQASLAQKISEEETGNDHEFGHSVEAIARQTRELQESVMAIRAQPVKSVFGRLPRVVRDLCDTLGKDVKLVMEGEHTEVDATVIEELYEPLTHMLRNSMDHGIEMPDDRVAKGKPKQGTIFLSAAHRGERVIITIKDDGAGINRDVVLNKAIEKGLVADPDALTPEEIDNLIFHPGFSTAQSVSSVSGRGVGMDVVRRKIFELGGRCSLQNRPGHGTVFSIALPLTLAVLDGMTVSVGGERFILPLSSVVEAVQLGKNDVQQLPDKSSVLSRRGEYLRLLSIRNLLRIEGPCPADEMAVIVETETDGQVAFLVDDLIGQRQVVLKSLEANYRSVVGVSGATILGDGRVALILDIPSIVSLGETQSAATPELVH